VFKTERYTKMHGTFVWPSEELGGPIEVTKAEFERLIFLRRRGNTAENSLRKSSREAPENVDITRVS
jgi:hypothetical protein